MAIDPSTRIRKTFIVGAIAGLAGGLAEIGWIWVLASRGGTPVTDVAQGISNAIFSGLNVSPSGVLLGLAIHLWFAAMLGSAMMVIWASFLAKHFPRWFGALFAIFTLILIWAVNFHIVSPVVSPEFLELVPAGFGLVSKLLFALAMLATLIVIKVPTPSLDPVISERK